MVIHKDYSLKKHNTFNIEAKAKYFIEVNQVNDLMEYLDAPDLKASPRLILGGGSNILFTKDFEGVVLHSGIKTIDVLEDTDEYVIIRVGSGMVWDDLVDYCVKQNWGGIENLSDIPGNVGAAPVQNIGAYGVEAKDTVSTVEAYDLNSGTSKQFENQECNFDYRDSIFKEKDFCDYFITHVCFKLSKKHTLNIKYRGIKDELDKCETQSIQTLREVIVRIRQSKLPSTDEVGSAGSFFKNPIISADRLKTLQEKHKEIPFYALSKNMFKVPAAWLIERADLKGFRNGDVGTFKNQALVIVNYGEAKGQEIAAFANHIQKTVEDNFDIILEPEVCFI